MYLNFDSMYQNICQWGQKNKRFKQKQTKMLINLKTRLHFLSCFSIKYISIQEWFDIYTKIIFVLQLFLHFIARSVNKSFFIPPKNKQKL